MKISTLLTTRLPNNVVHLRTKGLRALKGYADTMAEVCSKPWSQNIDLPEDACDFVAWHNAECTARQNGAPTYEAALIPRLKRAMYWIKSEKGGRNARRDP